MPIDTTSDDDRSTFAPVPNWERNRKRRGFSGARAAAAATPATADPLADDPLARDLRNDPVAVVDPTGAAASGDTLFAGQPAYSARARPAPRSALPAMAIMAGLIALGGLGAAAWYATQPHDGGMAQLTPDAPATSTSTSTTTAAPAALATNGAAPAASPAPVTSTPPASARVHGTVSASTATTRTARARPPASRSAGDVGVNASATLPNGPQPYAGTAVNPTPPAATTQAAPPEATPAPTPAPVESAPAPAPVQSTPEAAATPPAASPQ